MINRTKTQHSSRRQVIQIGIAGAASVGLLPKASNDCPYITGTSLLADGGMMAGL